VVRFANTVLLSGTVPRRIIAAGTALTSGRAMPLPASATVKKSAESATSTAEPVFGALIPRNRGAAGLLKSTAQTRAANCAT
jgi:hypothetical protein